MTVSIQTLERITFVITLVAEEEIVAVFAHPAILSDHFLAVKAVVSALFVKPGLHYHFKLVLASVVFP